MAKTWIGSAAGAVVGMVIGWQGAFADEAKTDPKTPANAETAGEPTAIVIEPAKTSLVGPRAYRQLLVTGQYADGSVRDLTRLATYSSADPKIADADAKGSVHAAGAGATTITAQVGSQRASAEVAVAKFGEAAPVQFHREVVAAFTRNRCNSGACHGTPSGKNGFRLSLQGYLPDQDYTVLSREVFGRRVNPLDPAGSLLLLKGTAAIPHEGGKAMWNNEEAYRVIQDWIGEGCKPTPTDESPLARLEILPKERTLRDDAQLQQVVVIAHFADGSQRDVTPLVMFSSSDEQVANVSKNGLVRFHKRGGVAILCRYLHLVDNAKLAYLKANPNFAWNNPPENNVIDKHVFAHLKELQILPSDLCTDEEFIRRIYLDVAGMIPTPEQARAFLADSAPDKRAKLIDQVLDLPEYADFWALKWADVLRNTRKTVAYRGAHNYRRYLSEAFAHDRPMSDVVSELLTSGGDTMTHPPANYYRIARDPLDCAETTAQLFMGVRMQCAKCHNHPFERWTQDDYYGFAAFFARVQRKKPDNQSENESIFLARGGEVTHPRTQKVMPPKAPGVPAYDVGANEDRRSYLAKWLTSAENPFFAKSVVNRLWFHLLGKGIVDPVDDFRDSNPPCNEELLNALAQEFVKDGFRVKPVLRLILNSRTYQLSAQTNPLNADDEKYFSRAYPKLLSAEALLDAICSATAAPEKFPGLPLGVRATQLPDVEFNHPFLQAFGQPTRELACECGRESESTLNQALNLINGNLIHEKLRNPENRLGKLMQAAASDEQIVGELYLATLSRPARPEEIATAIAHVKANSDRRRALEDVHWALLNSKEFLFRH